MLFSLPFFILVCKRWQLLSKEGWSDFKRLTSEIHRWGFYDPVRALLSSKEMNNKKLKKVLQRCGRFLKSFDFSYFLYQGLEPNALELVAKFCPNIQHINAGELPVSSSSLKALAKNCNMIKTFRIEKFEDYFVDDNLSEIFARNTGLERIVINDNRKFTGECLQQLNRECIRSIELTYCHALCLRHLKVIHEYKYDVKYFW